MSTPFGPSAGPRFDTPGVQSAPAATGNSRPPEPGVITPELGTVEGSAAHARSRAAEASASAGRTVQGIQGAVRSRLEGPLTGLAQVSSAVRSAVASFRRDGSNVSTAASGSDASRNSPAPSSDAAATSRRPGGGRRKRQRDDVMVPPAEFTSYYGRNIVKPAPWKNEIPAYLYMGGLAAGSALVAAGGEMTGRRELQRNSRLIALGALSGSTVALIADLGKPSRFYNMMRTVKLTSPMSVGSWILAGFGAFTGVAAVSEIARFVVPKNVPGQQLWPIGDRLASLGAGAFSAPLAAYTAVLLADTATPTWHASYKQLPFVFVGSALAASGGAAMMCTSPAECGPARRLAVGGSVLELGAYQLMVGRLGLLAEPLHEGKASRYLTTAKTLTVAGVALTMLGGRRRAVAILAGAALNAGSALTRFGVFEAGLESARDPKYTVIPQRERLERRLAQTPEERVSRRPGDDRVAQYSGTAVNPF